MFGVLTELRRYAAEKWETLMGVPNDVLRHAHIVIAQFVTKMCHNTHATSLMVFALWKVDPLPKEEGIISITLRFLGRRPVAARRVGSSTTRTDLRLKLLSSLMSLKPVLISQVSNALRSVPTLAEPAIRLRARA